MSKILVLALLCFPIALLAQNQIQEISYEAAMPLFDSERFLGDVQVEVRGEKIIWLDKDSLLGALKTTLEPDTLKSFDKLGNRIDPSTLPLPVKFNPEELRLEMTLALEQRTSESLNLMEEYQRRYEGVALRPAPLGGAINYRVEQNWASKQQTGDYFSAQFDSFVNINSFVIENQTYHQSNQNSKWFRGDTRLVKDFEKKQIRFQVGDVYPQIQGFMGPRAIGGLSISRNFSLNPYRLPYPTGAQRFTIRSRSLVKYFVNSILVKSEYLPAGNYTAKDIPLNNGLNTILIEATDDLGHTEIFVFRSAASINLLNRGESRFDFSFGRPFIDTNFKRTYRESDGELFSGFYQYGFNSIFSGSLYSQNQKSFGMLGSELIHATVIGNFSFGHAESRNVQSGRANSLSYQFISQGTKWFQSHTLGLRWENRTENFRNSLTDVLSSVQNNYSSNYTLPLASLFTLSLGMNYGDVRNNELSDRYGFDTTINLRLFEHHNLSFFAGRTRDEYKNWNDVVYAFLTITFPEKNNFLSTLYDQQNKTTKMTHIKDNQNRLFTPRTQTILENNRSSQSAEVDVAYPTPFADLGGRIHSDHNTRGDQIQTRGSVRLNSAFVFAYQDGLWGAGISRPVPNSFVLFRPEKSLRDQKVGLKSTSPYTESQTGLLGEITFSNLLPYQYRDIQLDPTLLDEGRSLKKEKFILYPTYRSAHLIRLEERGSVMLRGRLLNSSNQLISLEVGHVGDKTFFTNREGEFFIEGVEPGTYQLFIEGKDSQATITVPENERGMKDLGDVILPEEP